MPYFLGDRSAFKTVLKKIAQCFASGITQFLNQHTLKYQKHSKHFVCRGLLDFQVCPLCHPTTTFKCLRHRNNYAARAPRLTRARKVIRDSVQSSAGLLKVHICRCFQKMSLILCNSHIRPICRITFIIKLQTSCGALVTL